MKSLFRFIVFNNVWIALCAVSMLFTTRWFFAIPLKIDALVFFIFFATFYDYNLHRHVWHFNSSPFKLIKQFFNRQVPVVLRNCILLGFTGTVASFVFLDKKIISVVFIFSILTMAYSLPLIKWKNRFMRLREITYLKVFAVAFVWSFVTVVIPLMNIEQQVSFTEAAIIFIRRFLFIYAITIPFEIRGMETEKSYGNKSLPMIYGIRKMKITGLVFMALFCVLAAVHEKYFEFRIENRTNIFLPLMLSAVVSSLLILFSSSQKSEWYNKFFVDGMMILQLLLLIAFN